MWITLAFVQHLCNEGFQVADVVLLGKRARVYEPYLCRHVLNLVFLHIHLDAQLRDGFAFPKLEKLGYLSLGPHVVLSRHKSLLANNAALSPRKYLHVIICVLGLQVLLSN